MIPTRIGTVCCIVLCCMLAGCTQTGKSGPDASTVPADPRTYLDRMARFIARAQQFQTTVRMGYDVLQDSGQKIEFSERHRITISRPNRLRAEILKSSGEEGLIYFDGKTITAHNKTHAVYAQIEKQGSLDEVLEYFLRDLEMRLPLALMFRSDFPAEIRERIEDLGFVEVSAVTERPCIHLAARTDEIDFQVWIPETGDPLPQRLTITYRDEEGQPQFRADFEDWDMAAAIADADFAFTPPADAERIPFLAEIKKALGEENPKGSD